MYNIIEIELQGVKKAPQSSHAVSTAPLPEGTTEAGDEPVQLHRIADTVEVRLQKAEEATAQATQDLKQAQEEIIEKHELHNKRRNPSK